MLRLRLPVTLAALAAFGVLSALPGCGSVTKRPEIDDVAVATEANRMSEMVVERGRLMGKRVADLSTPLLIGNVDLCGDSTTHIIAMSVHNLDDYGGKRRAIMAEVYSLDEKIRVTLVGRDGPAHIAGVREGDVVLAVNDIETPRGMSASAYYRLHVRPLVEAGKPIKYTLLRDAEKITAIVQPVLSCNYPVRVVNSSVVNAYATGTSITMNSAFLEAFPDDDIVGTVLGHELAHNLMGHLTKMAMKNLGDEVLAGLMYGLTGTRAPVDMYSQLSYLSSSVDFEFEADYVGLYLTARAGLGYDKAPGFLRKLAMDMPTTINRSTTHPKLSERYVAMEAAIGEIRKKNALGQPLVPEMKFDSAEKKPSMKDGWAPVGVGLGLGD